MSEETNYIFKIVDYTPESMPFGRLVDYYSELKKMIGLSEHLHLINVFKSSHATCLSVDFQQEQLLRQRVLEIREGTAPKSALRARDQINQMLREDGTSGVFSGPGDINVIPFPGKKADEDILYRVRDQAVFSGELYHLAGTREEVKVRVATEMFGVVYCRATREMGVALRDFLFEQVKISGIGEWKRTTDGNWTVNEVTITDYAPVTKDSLRSTVNQLRALDIDWPEDIVALSDQIEERGGQFH